jgi:hypothetical protein
MTYLVACHEERLRNASSVVSPSVNRHTSTNNNLIDLVMAYELRSIRASRLAHCCPLRFAARGPRGARFVGSWFGVRAVPALAGLSLRCNYL